MNIQSDFEEFLQLLEEHQVDYMIVGGYAVGFHGYPRFTKGIDVFFEASAPNIDRLREALVEFGFREETVPREIFERFHSRNGTRRFARFNPPPRRAGFAPGVSGSGGDRRAAAESEDDNRRGVGRDRGWDLRM